MATGPEHYRAAERAIENAKYEDGGSAKERFLLDVAQIHATLALAAATAMRGVHNGAMDQLDYEAWDAVCGVQDGSLDEDVTAEPADDETGADWPVPVDADEYYASMKTDEQPGSYTLAQLNGETCARCGLPFRAGAAFAAGEHDGRPLFSHLACIKTAESEA